MPIEIVMPKLGLTMESGTIARWIKRTGESVREGEPLLEVSTDKISYEVESPASGTVARVIGNDGDEFACGDVIGLIAATGESDTPQAENVAPDISNAGADMSDATSIVEAPRTPAATTAVFTAATSRENGARIIASPAARRLARKQGIILAEIRGTGPRGRITLTDIEQKQPSPLEITAPSVTLSLSKGSLPPRLPPERRAIYRKMTEVGQLPLAQVETTVQVDAIKSLIDHRQDFRWTAFAVYAVARLLIKHASLRTDATTGAPFEHINIGIAADTPHGLIVPVIHNADKLPLATIEREITRLATLSREGKLTAPEIAGACFSISNVGPQRIERVAPLPDPPQTAILGIGAATQRPGIVDGMIIPTWTLTCVLTFDHRFIDGAPAARFLADFTHACNNPGVLL